MHIIFYIALLVNKNVCNRKIQNVAITPILSVNWCQIIRDCWFSFYDNFILIFFVNFVKSFFITVSDLLTMSHLRNQIRDRSFLIFMTEEHHC